MNKMVKQNFEECLEWGKLMMTESGKGQLNATYTSPEIEILGGCVRLPLHFQTSNATTPDAELLAIRLALRSRSLCICYFQT